MKTNHQRKKGKDTRDRKRATVVQHAKQGHGIHTAKNVQVNSMKKDDGLSFCCNNGPRSMRRQPAGAKKGRRKGSMEWVLRTPTPPRSSKGDPLLVSVVTGRLRKFPFLIK